MSVVNGKWALKIWGLSHFFRKCMKILLNEEKSVTGDWFIYQVEHRMDQSGYLCNVTLMR